MVEQVHKVSFELSVFLMLVPMVACCVSPKVVLGVVIVFGLYVLSGCHVGMVGEALEVVLFPVALVVFPGEEVGVRYLFRPRGQLSD